MKNLIAIFLLLPIVYANSQVSFDPVSKSINRINSSQVFDAIEYQYVGSRCGALNNTIGVAFDVMSDNKELAKIYFEDGKLFYSLGSFIGLKAKQTKEFQDRQYMSFVKMYSENIKEGVEKNNSIPAFIWNEVKACESVKQKFKQLDTSLQSK